MINRDVNLNSNWEIQQVDIKSNEWANLISKFDHLIFQDVVWIEVLEKGFNGEACCLILKKDYVIVGGMAGIILKVLFVKLAYFNIPYGGIIGESPQGNILATLLSDFSKKKGICKVRINNRYDKDILDCDGFHKITRETFLLDLNNKTYDQLWDEFKPSIRRDVRRAERNGLQLKEAQNLADVKEFYSLYLQSMTRNSTMAKYPLSFFEDVFNSIICERKGAILLATMGNNIIAGVLLIDSADISYYFIAGSKTETLKLLPNDFLINAAIRRAIEKGIDLFDFMGTGGNDEALEYFKLKWGAKPMALAIYDLEPIPIMASIWNVGNQIKEIKLIRTIINFFRK
jgi:hypothetical protein